MMIGRISDHLPHGELIEENTQLKKEHDDGYLERKLLYQKSFRQYEEKN